MADDEDNGLKYINQIAAIHRSQRDFLNHDVTKATAFVLTSMLAAPTAIEGVKIRHVQDFYLQNRMEVIGQDTPGSA